MTEVKAGAYDSAHLKKILGLFVLLSFLAGVVAVIADDSSIIYFLPDLPYYGFFILYIVKAMGREAFLENPALSLHRKDIPGSIWYVIVNLIFAFIYISIVPIPEAPFWSIISESKNLTLLLAFVVICLAAPFTEELIFRDFIWKIFKEKNYSDRKILILTSLIFALAHLELYRLPLLFVTGLLFGLLRLKTNRIGASMMAHFLTNLIAFMAGTI